MTDVDRTQEPDGAGMPRDHVSVRVWRGLGRFDLAKPPVPLLRWIGVVLTAIIYVALGAPTALGDWLWAAIIGGALLFPDIAGFGVAGVRVDLRKTQEELAALRNEIHVKSSANAIINNNTITPEALQDAISAGLRVVLAEGDALEPYPSARIPTLRPRLRPGNKPAGDDET